MSFSTRVARSFRVTKEQALRAIRSARCGRMAMASRLLNATGRHGLIEDDGAVLEYVIRDDADITLCTVDGGLYLCDPFEWLNARHPEDVEVAA